LPQYPHLVDTLDDRVTEMQISTAYTHTHTHTHGPAWRPVTNFKLLCFNKKQQSLPC
jgi:transposase